jgi:hypothetical protein
MTRYYQVSDYQLTRNIVMETRVETRDHVFQSGT